MTMEGTGIVPVMDMNNRNYGDGYGYGGMWFMWIIVLFALMWGGNGWGNRGNGFDNMAAAFANGTATRNEITNGFNNQDTQNALRGIQNGLCDGFYAQNTTMLNGFNGIQRDLCTGFAGINANINEARFAQQQCCCETNRNIDAIRYENAQNTCAITTNATANTQRVLDKLCQMESNAKDLRIADLQNTLQAANFQLSQLSQTANIINTVIPRPIPAYPVQSPYVGSGYAYGCGCNPCV